MKDGDTLQRIKDVLGSEIFDMQSGETWLRVVRVGEDRDGDWMDSWGACKVCAGEIPYGHTSNCDIWKLEEKLQKIDLITSRPLPDDREGVVSYLVEIVRILKGEK